MDDSVSLNHRINKRISILYLNKKHDEREPMKKPKNDK